jgi:hypothetical protein
MFGVSISAVPFKVPLSNKFIIDQSKLITETLETEVH